MNKRLDIEIVCPNNHNQTVEFTREQFEDAMKSDGLLFHCNTCDTNWTPSTEQIADMRKRLSKD